MKNQITAESFFKVVSVGCIVWYSVFIIITQDASGWADNWFIDNRSFLLMLGPLPDNFSFNIEAKLVMKNRSNLDRSRSTIFQQRCEFMCSLYTHQKNPYETPPLGQIVWMLFPGAGSSPLITPSLQFPSILLWIKDTGTRYHSMAEINFLKLYLLNHDRR